MGDVKENMAPSKPETKGIFDRWKSKDKTKKKIETDEDVANEFADHIAFSMEKLDKLIESKSRDLANEKGQEKENKRKLSRLNAMLAHLEIISDLMEDY
jgi:hypothetical protein